MESLTKRRIKDGSKYDHLFPKVGGTNEVIEQSADLSDTLELIPWAVENYHWQVAGIAKVLKGRSLRATSQNIWEFCYGYMQYTPDEKGKEQVRSPARSWRDRKAGVDCDCYSTFISSVFTVLGIGHTLRITKYPDPEGLDPDPPYQHIYVIVPNGTSYLTIDPVTDYFNTEVPFLKNRDIPMQLEFLNGAPSPMGNLHRPAHRGADYEDFFEAEESYNGIAGTPGKNRIKTRTPVARPTGNSIVEVRLQNGLARAIAAGQLPPNTSLEQFKVWSRNEFIRRHGKTPEQFAAETQAKIAASSAAAQKAEREVIIKLQKELRKLGVAYPASGNRSQLLALLRNNRETKSGPKLINAINRFNPATALVRTGILIGTKINFFGVGKLVWALVPRNEAIRRGWAGSEHDKITRAWGKLKSSYYKGGGKLEKLAEALIKGRYNKQQEVLSGLGSVSVVDVLGMDLYESEVAEALSGTTAGLGEAVTATAALAAATAILGAIGAILKSVKAPPHTSRSVIEPNTPRAAEIAMQEEAGTGNETIDRIIATANTASSTVNAFNQIRNGVRNEGGGLPPVPVNDGQSDPNESEWAYEPADEHVPPSKKKEDEDPKSQTDWVTYAKWGGLAVGVSGLLFVGYSAMKPKPGGKGASKPQQRKSKAPAKKQAELGIIPVP